MFKGPYIYYVGFREISAAILDAILDYRKTYHDLTRPPKIFEHFRHLPTQWQQN